MEEIKKDGQEEIKKPVETDNIWQPEKLEGYNGCSYYGWCKHINKEGLVNCSCFNPPYFMNKLDSKCTQLGKRPEVLVEIPKKGEVKETLRDTIKNEILKDKPKTFTIVQIISQEVKRGNKDVGLIFQSLKTIFTEVKDSDLRKRILPTIKYLEKKGIN